MSLLAFHLLGSPWIERDGKPLRFVRHRALALAIYLAVTGRRHSREQLMAIFWPNLPPSDARADLRRTLHILRRTLGDDWLITESGYVQGRDDERLSLDVSEFQKLLDACNRHGHPAETVCDKCMPLLACAADLYQDDFLAGFSLPDSPQFDAWQFFESERLRAQMADLLLRLIQGHTARHNYALAIDYAHRRLVLDPVDEESHRCLMTLYVASGQPAAAIRQYNQCRSLLKQELGIVPSAQTDELLRSIQQRANLEKRSFERSRGEWIDAHDDETVEYLPAEDEIRLVTVVSIGLAEIAYDVLDPALEEILSDAQSVQTIADSSALSFGGQCQSSASEDLLLFFGVDHVHEDDAERGVRAALSVARVADKQGLAIQVGVNSGMAYVRRPALGEVDEFYVMGPVISLATRLRNRAGAGQVLVGAGTYRLTRGIFVYESLSMTLPGIQGSVSAYRTQRPRRHPIKTRGIDGLHAEMIGRQDELKALRAVLNDVMTQNRGHLVSIVADAGVGKSRLVAEAKQQAEANAFLWLEGRSQALTTSTGYGLFTDMLCDYLSRHDAGDRLDADHSGVVLVDLLQRLRRSGRLSASDVEEIGPLLSRLLALRFDIDWDDRLNDVAAEQLRRRTLNALRRLFHAFAEEQPLVLICEDLHWADPLSVDLIGALMETLTDVPLVLIAVFRPEEAQADEQLSALAQRRCPDAFTELRLQPLNGEQSRHLVASLLAIDALPAEMRTVITDKSEGNPLYLEEIVRTLIDSDVLYRDGAEWHARHSLASVVVPASLQSVILSRVDRLEPTEKAYLQAAAVIGRLFRPRLVEAMIGSGAEQETTLAALTQGSLVYQERVLPEPEYSFHHVLVRDAVYQDLPRGYRVDLHRRAALAIEKLYAENLQPHIELLARHYDLGDDPENAIYYLLLAGQQAQRVYLNLEARTHYERVIARLDALEATESNLKQRLKALHALGEIQTMLDNLEKAEAYLRQAITLATELDLPPRQRVHYILSLCQFYGSTGDTSAQVEQCERGMALIAGIDAPVELVALTTYLSTAYANRGDWRSAISWVGTIIDILPTLPYSGHLVDIWFYAVLWYRLTKQPERGFNLIDPVIDEALRRRDFWSAGQLHLLPKLFLCETIGDGQAAFATINEALRLAEITGDKMSIRNCWYWLGVYHGWLCGNLDEAERYATITLEDLSNLYRPSSYVFASTVLGLVHYCRHDWPQAIEWLERSFGLARSDGLLVDGVRRGIIGLAWTYTMLDRKAEGLALLSKIAYEEELHIESWPTVACALAGLEPMCPDVNAYDALCREIVAARAEEPLPLVQWRLMPAEIDSWFGKDDDGCRPGFSEQPSLSGWTWHDQFGDCSYQVEDGKLIIRAANYRDLWLNNFAAPRFLRSIEGDFAVETICTPAYDDRLSLGGVLLWLDRQNYLRLTWNAFAPGGIDLSGCRNNVDGLFGIGRLPDANRIYLRLERSGDRVRGLCSGDGLTWYSVGAIDFPTANSVEVGPLAIGMIHRYVHAGAWPEGSAIRFEAFGISAGI